MSALNSVPVQMDPADSPVQAKVHKVQLAELAHHDDDRWQATEDAERGSYGCPPDGRLQSSGDEDAARLRLMISDS